MESPGVASLPELSPLSVWLALYRASDRESPVRAQLRLLSLAARMFPSSEQGRSSRRHAAELAKAVMISRSWSLQQVVDTILAKSYFGRGAYGLESAARAYYGSPAAGLNAEQSLALIVLMKGPHYYDPGCNRERFERRYLQAAALSSLPTDSEAPARSLIGLRPATCS